jgi:hypothetical protein
MRCPGVRILPPFLLSFVGIRPVSWSLGSLPVATGVNDLDRILDVLARFSVVTLILVSKSPRVSRTESGTGGSNGSGSTESGTEGSSTESETGGSNGSGSTERGTEGSSTESETGGSNGSGSTERGTEGSSTESETGGSNGSGSTESETGGSNTESGIGGSNGSGIGGSTGTRTTLGRESGLVLAICRFDANGANGACCGYRSFWVSTCRAKRISRPTYLSSDISHSDDKTHFGRASIVV